MTRSNEKQLSLHDGPGADNQAESMCRGAYSLHPFTPNTQTQHIHRTGANNLETGAAKARLFGGSKLGEESWWGMIPIKVVSKCVTCQIERSYMDDEWIWAHCG